MNQQEQKTIDFGFEQVPVGEKADRVRDVFTSVAGKYDVMNDLMSLGIHRIWKRIAVDWLRPRPGHKVLDLAGGTGDLTKLILKKIGPTGQITLSDINAAMLTAGKERLLDEGIYKNVTYLQANAESLPLPSNHFDRVIIGFGLRNVTAKELALAEMHRILKPGGQALVLEFSKVAKPLEKVYDLYSFNLLPKLGKIIANDADSYQYLAESIRMHPDQETLKDMMLDAGFDDCDYRNMSAGIVAMHKGVKY